MRSGWLSLGPPETSVISLDLQHCFVWLTRYVVAMICCYPLVALLHRPEARSRELSCLFSVVLGIKFTIISFLDITFWPLNVSHQLAVATTVRCWLNVTAGPPIFPDASCLGPVWFEGNLKEFCRNQVLYFADVTWYLEWMN